MYCLICNLFNMTVHQPEIVLLAFRTGMGDNNFVKHKKKEMEHGHI